MDRGPPRSIYIRSNYITEEEISGGKASEAASRCSNSSSSKLIANFTASKALGSSAVLCFLAFREGGFADEGFALLGCGFAGGFEGSIEFKNGLKAGGGSEDVVCRCCLGIEFVNSPNVGTFIEFKKGLKDPAILQRI